MTKGEEKETMPHLVTDGNDNVEGNNGKAEEQKVGEKQEGRKAEEYTYAGKEEKDPEEYNSDNDRLSCSFAPADVQGTYFDSHSRRGGSDQAYFSPHTRRDGIGWWGAFNSCHKLAKIKLPSTIKEIKHGAFSGCTELTFILIPEGVKVVNEAAFAYCKKLVEVQLPSTLKQIKDNAFQWCTSLISINIPRRLEYIGGWAFAACTELVEWRYPPL
eukprot:3253711-Ditylum_brightwellii.AAC.1